jgi:site-specific recombinase XerD
LLELTPASFQLDRGIVAIRTLKRRRHAMREVPLPPSLMSALDAHFEIAHKQRNALAANRRLWPWCRQTAWRSIKDVMDRAGIVGAAASPRGLRHAFGIATLQANVPLNLVSRWMGHARMSTTAIYADATGPEELAFAERFWRAGPVAVGGDAQAGREGEPQR